MTLGVMCRLATLILLAICSTASAVTAGSGGVAASASKHTDHRVIVKYSDHAQEEKSLEKAVESLQGLQGVVKAQPLSQLSMAVVSLESPEASEKLIEKLREEDAVELVVMDTFVSAVDLPPKEEKLAEAIEAAKAQAEAAAPSSSAALRALRGQDVLPPQCSAHPACQMQGLEGDCCPRTDGKMLSCCSASGPDLVTFRTAHGTYLAADANGEVTQRSGPLGDDGKWEIIANDDGTLSLRSRYGKYLASDEHFVLAANIELHSPTTRWELSRNNDNSVSLASHFQRYLWADLTGLVASDRVEASTADNRFTMEEVESPSQRFSNDPDMPELWGMHSWRGNDIDAPEAWRIWNGESGKGIVVAVIDTGIDYNHEDLREQMWVNPLEIPGNGIDDDNNGYVDDVHGADFVNQDGDPMDDKYHGTHCAGTIAGTGGNGIGVTGVAWRGVRMMALKFLDRTGSGRVSNAILAVDYAVAHGAKIASNSWSGGLSNPGLAAAIEKAEKAGMLFTAAASNWGTNNDETPYYPANYESENIISVASTDIQGHKSSFSDYGANTVHLAAPGSNVYSTTPGNRYRKLSGTSMATPHVSGLAALVWMYRPQLSMSQVRDIIIGSVKKMDSLENITITGGMINAKNALEAAWAFEPPQPPLNRPRGLAFQDTDPAFGQYSGTVVISAAEDESDIEYYQIYFVSGAGYQLDALGGAIPATGEDSYRLVLNGSMVPSTYARYLAVVPGNSSGELPALLSDMSVPRVTLAEEDLAFPQEGAHSLTWSGDKDSRAGYVDGTLTVKRARSESSITAYNLYWREANGSIGTKIATAQAIGFVEPSCTGRACGLLEMGRTAGGSYTFARSNYDSAEHATISVTGPGWVKVTKLDTEAHRDRLTIGSTRLSGNLSDSLPMKIKLGNQATDIDWRCNFYNHKTGWSIEVFVGDDSIELKVNSTAVLGTGFALVPEFRGNEEAGEALFIDIADATPEAAASSSVTATSSRGRQLEEAAKAASLDEAKDKEIEEDEDEEEDEQLLQSPRTASTTSQPPFQTLWMEASKEPSSTASTLGIVRSSIILPNVAHGAEPVSTTTVRGAVEATLGPLLQEIAGDLSLRSVQVAANSDGALQVTFEVETLELEPPVLNYVEAHLILLMQGSSRASQLFQTSLRSALEAEHQLPEDWAAELGPPQRLTPRMLLARFRKAAAAAQSLGTATGSSASGAAGSPDGHLRRLRGASSSSASAPVLV